jgi:hypothetical protein
MRVMETSQLSLKQSPIRWKRVLVAAVGSEIPVIAVLSAVMIIHRFLVAPGLSDAQYEDFAQVAGYYVAPPAGAISTFLCAWWVTRRLTSGYLVNGALVGIFSTLFTLGFIVTARPEHRWMYIVSYAGRIIAGYAAGLAAHKKGVA